MLCWYLKPGYAIVPCTIKWFSSGFLFWVVPFSEDFFIWRFHLTCIIWLPCFNILTNENQYIKPYNMTDTCFFTENIISTKHCVIIWPYILFCLKDKVDESSRQNLNILNLPKSGFFVVSNSVLRVA